MRCTTTLFFALALMATIVADVRGGGCNVRSRAQVFVSSAGATFVPFAVPVAVPVAVVNTPSVVYGYGYSGYAQAYRSHEQQRATTAVQPEAEAAVETTAVAIVTNRCTQCHSGDEPKGGLLLADVELGELDRDTRFSMLRRIMEPDARKRMPKGGQLSREEFDVLVDALVK